jgi:hypothetical protein
LKELPVSPSGPATRLAAHVRACRVGDQIILLDLHRSKYIGIGGRQMAALSSVVLGELDSRGEAPSVAATPSHEKWIRDLQSQGILVDATHAAPVRQAPGLPQPMTTMSTEGEEGPACFSWRDLWHLWWSTLMTSTWLRRHSLAEIARRVTALRVRHADQVVEPTEEALRAAVASYLHLRLFALTSHDRCLNDSLTLVHFLTSRGFVPRWVVGVRVHPFGAHSWVQCGGIVLNDVPERVRRFRPILVV